jgi:hypothetical protein
VRFLTCLVAALILAFFATATAAPDAGSATLTKRIAALEKKNKALTKKVNQLATKVNQMGNTLSCVVYEAVPLSSYGSGAGTLGYLFDNDGSGGGAPIFTTALDFTADGDPVHAWVAGIDPACLASPSTARSTGSAGSVFRHVFRAPAASLLRHQ